VKIVADAGIAHLDEALAGLGEVVCVDARGIDRHVLADADALVVRTRTRVDARLLDETHVRFVGSATSGIDHVDTDYLADRRIAFVHAAGTNANAVAEYVLCALAVLAADGMVGNTVGVVGFGHVGRRLTRRLRRLGHDVVVCDPPLARRLARRTFAETGPLAKLARDECYADLDAVMALCDVITLHVPLCCTGPDATHHMFDAGRLRRLRTGTVLVNTSRGAVVDNAALEDVGPTRDLVVVHDVWEGEPELRWSLVAADRLVRLATPHVAGYSRDAKLAAARSIHDQLCAYLGRTSSWRGGGAEGGRKVAQDVLGGSSTDRVYAACLDAACGLSHQHARLRGLLDIDASERAGAFEALRRTFVERRELSHHLVALGDAELGADVDRGELARRLEAVGFRVR
jgi:erythronate-4-phosphate dehydrogenase